MIERLILLGENGYGDEFCIGRDETFTILKIAKM